jgi:hypothetical protein
VLKILKDPELKLRLSVEGLYYAQSWQPDEMANRMLALYEKFLLTDTCLNPSSQAC